MVVWVSSILGAEGKLDGCQVGGVDEVAVEQHVVVSGVLRQRSRALIVHRCSHRRWYPDAWDLPGGHLTDGEDPRTALVRELQEELGVVAEVVGDPFAQLRGSDFRMDVWAVDHWVGAPINAAPEEHDALAWVTEQELHGLRLADRRLPQLLYAALSATS